MWDGRWGLDRDLGFGRGFDHPHRRHRWRGRLPRLGRWMAVLDPRWHLGGLWGTHELVDGLVDDPLLDPGVLVTWRGAVELVPGDNVDYDAQEGTEKEQGHVGRFVPPHVVHLEVDPEGTEYPGDPYDY